MRKYRYTGEQPVTVPDLQRYDDHPVQPGEVVETDVVINNSFFDLVEDAPAAVEPADVPEEDQA